MSTSLCRNRLGVTALLLSTVVLATSVAGRVTYAADEKRVKLSGCLIRGEGGDAGFLLTNTPGTEPWLNASDKQVTPSALGTSGDYATIFYWLDRHDDLDQHIGHRVEVEGDLKGEVKDGEIETNRKDNWTEVKIKSDGRSMTVRVPNSSIFPAPGREKGRKGEVLVRQVDVERVRMLGASCN